MSTPVPTLDQPSLPVSTTPGPSMEAWLIEQLTPLAAQAAEEATKALGAEFAAHKVAVEQQVAKASLAVATSAMHDPWTQRAIALMIAGAILVYCGAMLILAALGNAFALKWWATGPSAVFSIVMLASRLDGLPQIGGGK